MAFSITMIGIQILIIFIGGEAFPTVPLTGVQWAISLILGLLVLPIGVLLRCVPDWPLEAAGKVVRRCIRRKPREIEA
jgi:Ca2+-transporting ATPase